MANVMMQLLLDIKQLQGSLQKAQSTMQSATTRMSQQVQRTGRAMQTTSKKATGLAGAMDFLKKRVLFAGMFFAAFYQGLILLRQTVGEVITEFFDLDDSLRRVQSITKESDESIEQLRKELLSLAKSGALFDQSAADVADSMFTIAQAGFDTTDSLTLAKLAAEGAAVGFTTAEISAKVLVNVLKAYDKPVSEARDILDVLFQTVDTGIITFEDLSSGLGRVLASASALEVPLTDITGTVATLTLRGFTAAQGLTSVNRILQTFIRPSQRAAEAAAELGIELNRDTIAANGLVPMLNKMWVAAEGDANAFANMFDRIQSTRGALSSMSDDGALLAIVMADMDIATEGAGASALAYAERSKSLKFQMSILRVQILALVADALTPMGSAIAVVLKKLHEIFAGQNTLFNFFGDLQALVMAVAAAFFWLQKEAITGIFVGLAKALGGLVTIMRVSTAEVGKFGTAMRGLGAALSAVGPLLVFMAAFALIKFGKQFDPVAKATKAAQERLIEFNEAVARSQNLLDAGLITPEEFGLRRFDVAIETVVASIQEDFAPALESMLGGTESFGDQLGKVGSRLGRLFTGDVRSASTVLRDDFHQAIQDTIVDLKELGVSSEEIERIAAELRRLAGISAQEPFLQKLFEEGAVAISLVADEVGETKDELIAAAKASDSLIETFGDTLVSASDIKDAIEAWVAPIEAARALTEELLGLTNKQGIVYSAIIAPIEDRINLRNIAIADSKEKQLKLAEEMGVSLDDIEEGENAQIEALGILIGKMEDLNDLDDATIDRLDTRLEYEKGIGETQAANNVLSDLQNGKLDELTGELMPEQVRLLEKVVREFLPRGGEGITDWVNLTKAMGETLDEDVMQAILKIVARVEEGEELQIDVTQALIDLGLVESRLEAIARATGRAGHRQLVEAMAERGRGRAQPPTETPLERFRRIELRQGFADGVRNFLGGMALVGERGPELVRLPRGVDVVPQGTLGQALRDQSRERGGGVSVHVEANITTSLLKDFLALKREALKAVDEKLDEAAGRAGLASPRFGSLGAGMRRT